MVSGRNGKSDECIHAIRLQLDVICSILWPAVQDSVWDDIWRKVSWTVLSALLQEPQQPTRFDASDKCPTLLMGWAA